MRYVFIVLVLWAAPAAATERLVPVPYSDCRKACYEPESQAKERARAEARKRRH